MHLKSNEYLYDNYHTPKSKLIIYSQVLTVEVYTGIDAVI